MKTHAATRAFLLWSIALLSSVPLHAFDSPEHEGLALLALHANIVALQNASLPEGSRSPKHVEKTLAAFYEGIDKDGATKTITYGKIVELVDSMPDNYELNRSSSTHAGWPSTADETNINYLRDLLSDGVSLLSSSHSNQNHFQGRALYTFWFWHKEAFEAAKSGNLWGALLLNAYADHFLHDSFAPGHIISPRDGNSVDVYALLIHDSVNVSGMDYVVRAPRQCVDAFTMVKKLWAEDNTESTVQAAGVVLKRSAVDALLRMANRDREIWVRCYGDNQLYREEASNEVALIVAYEAQSIHDLVTAYLNPNSATNSFLDYRWNVNFGVKLVGRLAAGQMELIDVGQSFGDLVCEMDQGSADTITVTRDSKNQAHIVEAPAKTDVRASLPQAALHDPAFGLSLGINTMSDRFGAQTRGLFEGEALVLGGRWDYLDREFRRYLHLPRWPNQFAISAGYSGLFDGATEANGSFGRLILPVAKLNGQFSVYGGERFYSGHGQRAWRSYSGARAEWGFGLAYLFLGIGLDYYPLRETLVRGTAFETGFSFETPWSRVKGQFQKQR